MQCKGDKLRQVLLRWMHIIRAKPMSVEFPDASDTPQRIGAGTLRPVELLDGGLCRFGDYGNHDWLCISATAEKEQKKPE